MMPKCIRLGWVGMAVCVSIAAQQPPQQRDERIQTVQGLVEAALARNADLVSARQSIAEAQGLLRQAGLRPRSAVEAGISTGDATGSRGERSFDIGYSHTFELGGKRGRRVESALLAVTLARLEIDDRARLLRAELGTRYIEALAAMRNLANAQRLLDLTRQSLSLAEARSREGEGSELERRLLEVEVNRMDSDRLLFRNQVERAVLELRLLTGLDAESALGIREPLRPPPAIPGAGRVLALALERRADLQAARVEEQLAQAGLRLARSEAAPDLVASARYSYSQSRFDQYGLAGIGGPVVPLRDRDSVLGAGIAVTLPFGNRNQGNIEASEARLRAARLRREAAERRIRFEAQSVLSRADATVRALRLFETGVLRQAQDNLQVVRSAHELGELRLLDVINEQRRLLDIQRAYTDLLRDANLALVELERAAGAPLE